MNIRQPLVRPWDPISTADNLTYVLQEFETCLGPKPWHVIIAKYTNPWKNVKYQP